MLTSVDRTMLRYFFFFFGQISVLIGLMETRISLSIDPRFLLLDAADFKIF
jgi:hypothetical protein